MDPIGPLQKVVLFVYCSPCETTQTSLWLKGLAGYSSCIDLAMTKQKALESNLICGSYLESKALFTQCTLVVHFGWPAQGYYDACGFYFLFTNFARSMQSAVRLYHGHSPFPFPIPHSPFPRPVVSGLAPWTPLPCW